MKILEIDTCNQCPFFQAIPINYPDDFDKFKCECNHPNSDIQQWENKIGRTVPIPGLCPLENYEYKNQE